MSLLLFSFLCVYVVLCALPKQYATWKSSSHLITERTPSHSLPFFPCGLCRQSPCWLGNFLSGIAGIARVSIFCAPTVPGAVSSVLTVMGTSASCGASKIHSCGTDIPWRVCHWHKKYRFGVWKRIKRRTADCFQERNGSKYYLGVIISIKWKDVFL